MLAGLFLIHERKLTETHEVFFKKLSTMVRLKGLPIVTDMEMAILRAIEEQTQLKHVGCWRHLRTDVQHWLSDRLPKVDRGLYINDLFQILRSPNEQECMAFIERAKERWNTEYTKYFNRNIEPKLSHFCLWAIGNFVKTDPINGITTNASEGFNFLIKDFQNWKEVPLDCLLMSLKLIQGFYLEEIRRGKAGLGTYSLKRKYLSFATNVEEFETRRLVCHPKDIVASLREKEVISNSADTKMKCENATNSRIFRAKQLVEQDSISFSARLGVFTVVDKTFVYTTRLFPSELCSCAAQRCCIHIMAVKIGQGMEIRDEDLAVQNTGVIRKKNRAPLRLKPGRKRPRPGDVSIESEMPCKSLRTDMNEPPLPQLIEILEQVSEEQLLDVPGAISIEPEMLSKSLRTDMNEPPLPQLIENVEQVSEEHVHDVPGAISIGPKNPSKSLRADKNEQSLSQLLQQLQCSIDEAKSSFQPQIDTEEDMVISFNNILSSTPNSSLAKDIRYSLEVWIAADKEILFHNLNLRERNILTSQSEWLNDIILDSAMNILQYQFPDLEGFESCYLAANLDYQRHEKLFIQIFNRSPKSSGTHWLTVSNINCLEDEITIYDSAYSDLPHIEELVVASLVKTDKQTLKVKFSNTYTQSNGNDCGLYAIANAVALAFGRDPAREPYIQREMRGHLIKCLEDKEFRPFPIASKNNRRKLIKKCLDVKLFCLCNMPDTRTTYILCDNCNDEYHPECMNIYNSIHQSTEFLCPKCNNKL